MISVEEATAILNAHLWQGGTEQVALMQSLGRVLAHHVVADRDFPPFDRVTMDGIAIAHDVFLSGQKQFPIAFVQAAGAEQRLLPNAQVCAEVMTGALLPTGADTVVRYEDLKIEGGMATVVAPIKKGQNIHTQGKDALAGDILLEAGAKIGATQIPLLASVGLHEVPVRKLPSVAVVSTGDELVEVSAQPLAHQIRRSNVYAIAAALQPLGITAQFFHLQDDAEKMAKALGAIVTSHDVVILSGGVSKGQFDFVPQALAQNGIAKKFHEVRQRPGKPMYFGVGAGKTVFGLPGNPVSTFMCVFRYVLPWLNRSLGVAGERPKAVLASDVSFEPALTYFLQVKLELVDGQLLAHPIPGGGSGDFVNLRQVNGFLELTADRNQFKAGERYPVVMF